MRWNCAADEYSELATLLHSGQEGLIKHLIAREPPNELSLGSVGVCFGLYCVLAAASFGINVPGGIFIPGLTMGAALGRFFGELLVLGGLASDRDRGTFALLGSAASISGITRMTLTIAVILVEVRHVAATCSATCRAMCPPRAGPARRR